MEGRVCRPFPPGLTVIETLRLDPEGPVRGDRHLHRMGRAARTLDIAFDRDRAERMLNDARAMCPRRARLTLDLGGTLALTTDAIAPVPPVWRLDWARGRITAHDPWRRMKTSQRQIYDDARAGMAAGIDELLFLNDRGEVAEGAITTLFIAVGADLLTPPIVSGALPGILREELICSGRARVARIRPSDLRGRELFVGNSLRGLVPARLD